MHRVTKDREHGELCAEHLGGREGKWPETTWISSRRAANRSARRSTENEVTMLRSSGVG